MQKISELTKLKLPTTARTGNPVLYYYQDQVPKITLTKNSKLLKVVSVSKFQINPN